mmetsp:Transcript_81663/g.218506  ORF Transcript_81663/g.218506 Transcript_81663/m.218506 type:complete len:206 (-) Transcript_81663:5374-5991(-)
MSLVWSPRESPNVPKWPWHREVHSEDRPRNLSPGRHLYEALESAPLAPFAASRPVCFPVLPHARLEPASRSRSPSVYAENKHVVERNLGPSQQGTVSEGDHQLCGKDFHCPHGASVPRKDAVSARLEDSVCRGCWSVQGPYLRHYRHWEAVEEARGQVGPHRWWHQSASRRKGVEPEQQVPLVRSEDQHANLQEWARHGQVHCPH